MFRRSRFSVRPNVGATGRTTATAAAPQEAPAANQEANETPRDAAESSSATVVTDNKSDVTSSEKILAPGDGNDPNGEGTSSSAAVQRRKRFSIKPKVAPGRPSALSRTAKSPVKAVSQAPVEGSGSNLDKPTTSGISATPQGFQSPRRRRPSAESKLLKMQPKAPHISSSTLGLSDVPADEASLEHIHVPADGSKQLENISTSQVKEVPPRPPDKVPPSLPDKEAIEISEKAKTLVSSKNVLSLTQSAYSLSKLLNSPSDLQRLVKAQKLRELLRQERSKEKKLKKAKALSREFSLDPAKMTMRDLIRYLPTSNPMSSSIEDLTQEKETVIPPSPEREKSPERAQEPEAPPATVNSREEDEEDADEDQEEALMVPQVKVAEDGSLIIDEESLTVEVQRAKGPNPAENRDPIFERGSTTTYSSFRKGTYSKPWSSEETDMFFLAVSMVGTDFSMICQLFPHRARSEIKNKFKKEERENSWRIDKAFRERRKLDIEYFSKLLEKILEFQKSRKKLKSLAEKNSPKKRKRKTKAKKTARKLSDVEEGDEEEDENQVPDLEAEEEGEKENEDLCNEGGIPASEPNRKCKRKKKSDDLTEEPNDKKNKTGEAGTPEDTEAALPEDHTSSDMSEKSQNVNTAKDTVIKPAKLSRGRAAKPLLPLGRKWGKKLPPSTTARDTAADKGDESVSDGATTEQVTKDASPSNQAGNKKSASDDISSEEEEEDVTFKPPQPTRYGRVPKPTKPLTYPAKEDAHSSASETTPASPAGSAASAAKPKPKGTAKRRRSSKPESPQKSKKPKLVTLRASQSDFSDEDEDVEGGQLACSSSRDGHAPIFVPASLNTSHSGISEVDESMVELDILASMPDVLGISQDALCPDSSCEQAQHEAGSAEPCEHQLDLLVDVIDFLSSEHTEVNEDESYNEAAQTLLTIGNLAHISQSAPNPTAMQDPTEVAGTSAGVDESCYPEEDTALKHAAQEESAIPSVLAAFSQEVTETSETVATLELQGSAEMPVPPSESSDTSSPQTKRGRLPKVKPKPNLCRTSRTAQPKSRPETSSVTAAEESHSVAPSLSPTNEMLSAVEETATKTSDCVPGLVKDDISSTEVKLTEEPSDRQEKFVEQVESSAAMSDQNSSEVQAPCYSESQFEPNRDQTTRDTESTSKPTDEKLKSCVDETKAGFIASATSDSVNTEVEKESHTDSAPVQESSDKSASCVSPAGDVSEKQKEESMVPTTCLSRRGRLQKVKPKPNLAQTSRTAKSKLQTTEAPADKDSSLTLNPDFHRNTTEVEPQPSTCNPSHEAQSHPDPASLNLESESSIEQETRDKGSTSEFTHENLTTSVGTTESRSNDVMTTNSTVTESQVEQGSNAESSAQPTIEELPVSKDGGEVASACRLRRSRLQKPRPNLPQASRSIQSKLQTRKDAVTLLQIVEKPHSPTLSDSTENTTAELEAQPSRSSTPPEKSSQIQSSSCPSVPVQSLELDLAHKCTQELSSTEDEKTDVGLVSSAEDSEKNVPQRRRRFPKVKPNLGSSTRMMKLQSDNKSRPPDHCHVGTTSNVSLELQSGDSNQNLTEKDNKPLTSVHCSSNAGLHSVEVEPTDSEQLLDITNNKATSSDNMTMETSCVAEYQPVLTDPGSSEQSIVEIESSGDKFSSKEPVDADPTSHDDGVRDMSTQVTETNVQQTDDSTAVSEVQLSKDASKESNKYSECPDRDSSIQTDDREPELTDTSKPSRKAHQVRRGRLIKPKPNLACSSRPSQARKVQNTTPAETDSGSCSQIVTPSVDHKPASELRPDMQEPVKEVIGVSANQTSTPSDAGSSVDCWPQVISQQSQHNSPSSDCQASLNCVPSAQIASTPSMEGIQSYPVFSGLLPEQVPSDPDEPFFILSLTEIPVSSSGEVVNSAAEHLSYLPATDASVQQPSSVCADSLVAAGDLAGAQMPMSAGGSGVMDPIDMKDTGPEPAALIHSTIENPVDPHETATVQPEKRPDTADNSETDVAAAKQTLSGARRRAKPQVKSSNVRKTQTSNTLEAESIPTQINTTQQEHPGDSVPPKAFDDTEPHKGGGVDVDTNRQTLTGGRDAHSSSSTQTDGTSSWKRKPKDFAPFPFEPPSVNPPPGKTADEQSSLESAASTSHDVAPTPSSSQPQKEARSTPTQTQVEFQQTSDRSPNSSGPNLSTSQATAEVSASQQSECVESSSLEEEEPTSVSQYFLSDIFTEVEEE